MTTPLKPTLRLWGITVGLMGIAAIYSDGLINLGGMSLTAAMIAMAWFSTLIGLIFLGFMAVGFVYFNLTGHPRANAPADAMLSGA